MARVVANPKYPCEKVTLNAHAPTLPLVADDGSYTPPYTTGTRHIQGAKWVDALKHAVIPVRGLNNHGGVKLLGIDTDGRRTSNAVEASIEMYGIAPGSPKAGDPPAWLTCLPCSMVGTGRGQWPRQCAWLYAPYNACQPYKASGDGLLARWPIIQRNEKVGELTLTGRHLEDWQLAFQGCGEIHLPCVTCYGVIPSTARVTKHAISTYTTGGQKYLAVQEFERLECFGMTAGSFYNRRGDWEQKSCFTVELGGGAPVGSYQVSIETLTGSPAPGCFSHWCDLTLHLVQVPIGCAGKVTGYKLI